MSKLERRRWLQQRMQLGVWSALTQREVKLLTLIYGLDGNPGRPVAEVAAELGISEAIARQYDMAARRKLRKYSYLEELLAAGIPLPLSTALGKAGIYTLKQLRATPRQQLAELRNLSPARARQIEHILSHQEIRLP